MNKRKGEIKMAKKVSKTLTSEQVRETIFKTIDTRVFGGLVTDPKVQAIGAIQLEWAESLHPIIIEEKQITTAFKAKEKDTNTSMGMKTFIPYGLYVTGGIYCSSRGKNNLVTSEDLAKFDEGIIKGSSQQRTGIKGFIQPILYLRALNKKENKSMYRFLHKNIKAEYNDAIYDREDVKLNVDELVAELVNGDYHEIRAYIPDYALKFQSELAKIKNIAKDINEIKDDDNEYSSEYVIIWEVVKGNPNGDPANGNLPRTWDNSEIGIISPERQKRWVRDYWESEKNEIIFVSRNGDLMTAYQRAEYLKSIL